MRFTTTSALCALPLLALAGESPLTRLAAPTALETPIVASDADQPSTTTFPSTNSDSDLDYTPSDEEELRRRQNPGQVVGENVPPQEIPKQKSPVTTFYQYDARGNQVPIVYTQLFSAVPEQWPDPKSGSIGLGTITGQVGVVKASKTKRDLVAKATDLARRAVMVDLEARAKGKGGGGKSGNNTNAAGANEVPWLGGAVLVAGLLAEFL